MTGTAPEAPVPGTQTTRRFRDKVVFITGAARGQGRAEAVRFAAEGADIIALDICEDLPTTNYPGATPEDLAETARLVEKLGRRVRTHRADVRDFPAVRAALGESVAELGRLDVVVANAGMTTAGRAWEIDLEHWRATIDINLTGAFHTVKAAVPLMIEQATGVRSCSPARWPVFEDCRCSPTTWRPNTESPDWPRHWPTNSARTGSGSTPCTRTAWPPNSSPESAR